MLEIGQYFRISQNGIDDKKSGTDGVVQSKNTRKNVNLSKIQNSKKKKKKRWKPYFHAIPTLVPIIYFHHFYSLFRETSSILVFSVSALTGKSYMASSTIKIIIIKFFILALKNVT